MKKHNLKVLAFTCITAGFFSLQAQVEEQKKEEIRFKTVSVIDGVQTNIDTTFESQEQMQKFMKEMGIEIPKISMDAEEDLDINLEEGANKKIIKKVIKREITVNDSGENGEKIIELFKDQDIDIKMLQGEEGEIIDINSILDSKGLEGKNIKVVIIKRTIEVSDLKEDEKKAASIDDTKPLEVEEFNIVPNPTKNEVNLQIETTKTGKGQVRILDMTGKIIMNQDLESLNGTHSINVKDLSSGTYIIQVAYQGYLKAKKLMIE